MFQRLYSTNFSWSILEYFLSNIVSNWVILERNEAKLIKDQ